VLDAIQIVSADFRILWWWSSFRRNIMTSGIFETGTHGAGGEAASTEVGAKHPECWHAPPA
jgi:hypothetical protein